MTFNDGQEELFSVVNWIVMHSNTTPTEAIEVLSSEISHLKEGLFP